MVFLKLFLRLPVVLLSSPLQILERFWLCFHSNRIHVMRNDLNWFIEEDLFCLHDGRKTDGIWNYIFQRGRSSIVAIGPVWLCLVKIYIYKKNNFFHLKCHCAKSARPKIVLFQWVILRDIAFRMIPNIAWPTPHILARWGLEADVLFRKG